MRTVILGGGTAGWMTAAGLARLLGRETEVTLVESAEIGIVGVGEATLPHIRAFNQRLGIDEAAFMAETLGTFKLGIDFHDFGAIGEAYIHPFGSFGAPIGDVGFHHYWLRAGAPAPLERFSLPCLMARAARFAHPDPTETADHAGYGYAYQFDATRFAPFLRARAEADGAVRIEGRVVGVERHGESGDVAALILADGRRVVGDLFVDCSGFAARLIEGALAAPWEDWSRWLPCDRAVALPCTAPAGRVEPYTRATAMAAGWRWRIPLQHRVGNGYVYSSAHLADEAAADAIAAALDGPALAEPRLLRFRAGRRRASWVGNVVSVGLASGFLEPLESTSLYLAQMAITELVELFPDGAIDPRDRAEFNVRVDHEYDRIRDFLILHYTATRRDDSDFWRDMRALTLPDTLAERIELWRATGRVAQYSHGLFLEPSWIAVLIGQGILPHGIDPRAAAADPARLGRAMAALDADLAARVAAMPDHAAALGLHARAADAA
ncbi:tryptophan halogenase [Sphingomonas spermidinifaciens]|uniref:Tryptophan halogenase n=1 Tax=Sphingomonas spermidinifaciens TaxID=1141889 RepID=A0A2A4B3W0_9SPHN|nr:tryptophan halogenase family protein [Sphingomonas spermidinifaciens]PCD02428.1 tryptophan halogenase [Sphingomonas spermidinifaciens]